MSHAYRFRHATDPSRSPSLSVVGVAHCLTCDIRLRRWISTLPARAPSGAYRAVLRPVAVPVAIRVDSAAWPRPAWHRRGGAPTARRPRPPLARHGPQQIEKILENFRETQRGLAAGGGCPRVCPVTNPDEGDMRPAGGGAAGLRHANRTARSKAVCPPGERHRPAVRGSRLQLDGRGRSGPDATVEAPEDPWESSAPSALATAAGQGDPEVRRAPLTVDGARG